MLNASLALSDNNRMAATEAQSSQFDLDLVCIGCGPAGEKAATQAAYFGHRVAIIEQQARPGGAMVNTGTVPSKALRETALLCSAFNRRPLPGMDFRLDRSMSVPRFMARRHLMEQQEHDRIESAIDRHNIVVHFGRGQVCDAHTIEIQPTGGHSHRITSRFILIATGSSPLRPAHVPFDKPNVVDADGVLQLQRLPASMIIVGGGVIGCEYACIFAEIGVHITLIHNGDHILPFVDPECRTHLQESMMQQGIDFMPNRAVSTVHASRDNVSVTLDDNRTLSADCLLWAAGRCSNTGDLGLEKAGVTLGQRGLITVNEHYQTNVPSIYAAGDVIGFPALAATSMEQGRIATCHMFNIDFKKRLSEIMPIGIYTIPAVSMVGLSFDDARKKGLDVVIGLAHYRDNVRGRMLGDETGLVKCIFDRRSPHRALLGAAIVGEDATELIHQAQIAIAAGLGIDFFINTCFNYPSLSELYKYAAYSALQAMKAESAESAKSKAA